MATPKPVVLCILDGWGQRAETVGNAPLLAQTPAFDAIMATCPHATLITHGPDVGLPTGQMGNSEVGHTNIGAGRVVAMDLGQIDLAIEDGSFAMEPALVRFVDALRASRGTAHVMSLVSDGGVHGHIDHLVAACRAITAAGVPVAVHAITDGRDVAPTSAGRFIADLQGRLPDGARIVTVIGRYFAMDRDNRWDRVRTAYDAMVLGRGDAATSAGSAVAAATGAGKTDEFIPATVIGDYAGMAPADGLFCLNFRADRAREILAAIADPDFTGWDRGPRPALTARLGMVQYSTAHDVWYDTVYPKRDLVNTLGEWVAKHGLTQFRLAETEKYPHVTFFLNGGKETPRSARTGRCRSRPRSPPMTCNPRCRRSR
jgi:2,3-bisphosphoglycerate-independent phosphoglycerate mutase